MFSTHLHFDHERYEVNVTEQVMKWHLKMPPTGATSAIEMGY